MRLQTTISTLMVLPGPKGDCQPLMTKRPYLWGCVLVCPIPARSRVFAANLVYRCCTQETALCSSCPSGGFGLCLRHPKTSIEVTHPRLYWKLGVSAFLSSHHCFIELRMYDGSIVVVTDFLSLHCRAGMSCGLSIRSTKNVAYEYRDVYVFSV
jgi:hypothetical protein